MKLPLKLGILVIVIFGLLFAGMTLWKPMKVRYYASRLDSDNTEIRADAVKKLLALDPEPVFRLYTERYESKEVKERMAVVDELCGYGDKGKAMMKEIFRNWCCSPSQQVKIPAGTLTLANGSKVKIQSLWIDKYEVTYEKYCVFCMFTNSIFKVSFHDKALLGESYDFIPLIKWVNEAKLSNKLVWERNLKRPIQAISFQHAKAYADWLHIRLPVIYEWEYAARAGSTGKYCFGDNKSLLGEYAWYKDNSFEIPHPVGQKKVNNWGLYDVHGNVREWCSLGWQEISKWPRLQVLGGSYMGNTRECTLIYKGRTSNVSCFVFDGFRCVRDAE